MPAFNLCPICLRTGRQLKTIASNLAVYHDELTDYQLNLEDPKYCSECEWLLRKTYKFHKKCSMAQKILNKWIKLKKKDRPPAETLHRRLPPQSLGNRVLENGNMFTYIGADDPDMPCFVSVTDSPERDNVEREVQHQISKYLLKMPTISRNKENYKILNTNEENENNKSIIQDMQTNSEAIENIPVVGDEKLLKVFKLEQEIDSSREANNTNNNVSAGQTTAYALNMNPETEVKTIDEKRFSSDQEHEISEETNAFTPNMLLATNNITENNEMVQLKNEILPTNENSLTVDSNIDIMNPDDFEDMDEIWVDGDNDIDIDDDYKDISEVDEDNDFKNIFDIDDDNDYQLPVDSSDDDCDVPTPKKRKKLIPNESANTMESDEDIDSDNEFLINKTKKNSKDKNSKDVTEHLESKLEAVNANLNWICENWEVTSLADFGTPNVFTDDIRIITHKYLGEKIRQNNNDSTKTKKLKNRRVTGIMEALDIVNKESYNILEDFKNGSNGNKKRLNAELIKMLESRDELKTEQGYKFDKALIIDSIEKVTEPVIKQLMRFLKGTKSIRPGAERILRNIEKKQLLSRYESVFDVEYLTTQQEILDEFERRKTYPCYVEANYKCEICHLGFDKAGHLKHHKKTHSDSKGAFSCNICHIRLPTERKRKKHNNGSHSAVYKCKMCPLVTYYKLSMINHYEQHMGVKYKCGRCESTFKSRSGYLTHQSKEHPRGTHVCTICGRAYVSQAGLKQHKIMKHRDAKADPSVASVNCESCSLKFPSPEALGTHMRMTHSSSYARIRQSQAGRLKVRRLGQTKDKAPPRLSCRVCKESNIGYGWLVCHFSTKHPTLDITQVYADRRIYLCDICGKGFSLKYQFRDHMDFHNGMTHQCPECPKRCPTRVSLSRHRMTHGPPRYGCDQCGKKFHTRANLYNHMRTHIGDRRFKCHICEKGFLHRFSLTGHIQSVHNHVRPLRKRRVSKRQGANTGASAIVGADATVGGSGNT